MDSQASSFEMSTMPSELAGPSPRKVQLSSEGDGRYLLVVVLVFFVGGLIFQGWNGYDDIKQFQQRALLRGDTREVVGEVTGFSFGRNSPMSVIYRFTVNGVTYSGKALEPANPGPGTSFEKGDDILIRFLPSNPAINHPDAWEWSAAIGWYFVVGELFFTSMGGLALAVLLRDRRLAREGKVAAGIVTGCARDDRWFRVDYEFRTEGGVLMKGHNDFKEEYGARESGYSTCLRSHKETIATPCLSMMFGEAVRVGSEVVPPVDGVGE
jgi:hypothetical protein